MNPATLLATYCVLIAIASVAGGLIPLFVRLTHRRTELALSFVSGVMLGVGLLELLPHALEERAMGLGTGITQAVIEPTLLWLLGGFLAMFLLERFFCFHHHDVPGNGDETNEHGGGCGHGHDARHGHKLTWGGAAVGLSLHSVLAGVALAASVLAHPDHTAETWTGLGAFLVIVLHKPFDSLTLGALLAAGSFSRQVRHLVNFIFALAVPVGVVLLTIGAGEAGPTRHIVLGAALAFSAGMFICIALSDLLPELQFHRHDRVKLTVALLLGLTLAWGVARLEHAGHDHGTHGHGHEHEAGGDPADDNPEHDDQAWSRPGSGALLLVVGNGIPPWSADRD